MAKTHPSQPSVYYIFSDIHGRREAFETLAHDQCGFRFEKGVWTPPKHSKAQVDGDIVERGPDTPGIIALMRDMEMQGYVDAYMGNHDFDSVYAWDLLSTGKKIDDLKFSSPRKKELQTTYRQYVDAYGARNRKQAKADIEWLRQRPYFGSFGNFRIAHASYEKRNIALLDAVQNLDCSSMQDIAQLEETHGVSVSQAMTETLKGKILPLCKLKSFDPNNIRDEDISYIDTRGTKRNEARVKAWVENTDAISKFSDFLMVPDDYLQDYVAQRPEVARMFAQNFVVDPDEDDRLLFLGHYYLRGEPQIQNERVICLDYKDYLVAYRLEVTDAKLSDSQILKIKL